VIFYVRLERLGSYGMDKQGVHIQNLQPLTINGSFCDEHGSAVRPEIIQDYNTWVTLT
jgi:hypothetical protein